MSTKMQQTLKVPGTSKYVNFIEITSCHDIMNTINEAKALAFVVPMVPGTKLKGTVIKKEKISMKYLSKPFNNGKINLKNRLIMPPMATAKSETNGRITQDLIDYYDEKSKGGYISLIIIEHSYISEDGKASKNQISIAEDSVIDDLRKLSDVIHKNGSKTVMQINHAGSRALEVGNSIHRGPIIDKDEIKEIIYNFRKAAIRVKEAGFDGVEIHSAHNYLLNQFLSPITNKREDEYGGNIHGRIRIHLDVIKAVREAVGEEFPILIRLGATDDDVEGLTLKDAVEAAKCLEKAGVDMIDVSGGMCRYMPSNSNEQGYFSTQSEEIKKAVNIPVMLTGGITDPYIADRMLENGKADFIGVGRAILYDSLWAKRAMELQ